MSETVNIASHLPARAREQPDRLAVAEPRRSWFASTPTYTRWTYRQLDDESTTLARGLEARGLRRGMRTVLMVKPSLDFFALTFALFKLGAVPVLVDPGMGVRNLGKCLAEAQPEAFIGITKAHIARLLFGWAKATLKILVTVGPRLGWGGFTLNQVRQGGIGTAEILAPTRGDESAAILFTSGSTGVPKGAVYTHGIFAAQVELLRTMFGIEPGEIDLCTFPLFALFAPALGMTAIIPEMDFTRPGSVNPRNVLEPIRAFRVTNLFGSPALLRRVAESSLFATAECRSLRRVLSAGAPVPAPVLAGWQKVLPEEVQVFTPYGATEALPVACLGSREILGETCTGTSLGAGVCVGRPVPGVEVAVIRIDDASIAEWNDHLLSPKGEIGEIAVKGPVVTWEYLRRPDLTALAKIRDPRGGVWHRMGDVGYFDEQGRLWFCGRKSQRVRTEKGTLFADQCEGTFNTHPEVLRTALVGVGPPGQQRPVLCVELKESRGAAQREQIRRELQLLGAGHDRTRDITTFLFHPAFPVDIRHNSKIFREKLAEWAARQLR